MASVISPKISVIIPCFNAEQTIEKCLLSVLNQTYRDLEVIVVDDKSTDNTPSILKKITKHDKRVKVYENETNLGQGFSRNYGISNSSGQIVTFIDADDYIYNPTYIEHCVDQLLLTGADVVVTPAVREYPGDLRKYDKFECSDGIYQKETISNFYLSRVLQTHAAWGKFYRSELLKNVKFVECGYSQDVIFVLDALLKSRTVCVFTNYGYIYSQKGDSTWRGNKITLLHVLSGIRLLAEILAKQKNNQYLALKKFISIWNKDHGRRLNRYIKQHNADWNELNIFNRFLHSLGKLFIEVLTFIESKEIREFLLDIYRSSFHCEPILNDVFSKFITYAKSLRPSELQVLKPYPQKLIISITSFPARIQACADVISGILSQKLPENYELVLYLSEDEFKSVEELPLKIKEMFANKKIKIRFTPGNIKSYKKLIPALNDYPDSPILTLDDDVRYPPNFVSALYEAYLLEPTQIHCNRCRRVRMKEGKFLPYKSWPLELRKAPLMPSQDLLFTGIGGVLYPPNSLYSSVMDSSLFSELCPKGDDLWFWLMAVMKGTKIHRVNDFIENYDLIDGTQENSLWKSNGKSENDLALNRLVRTYPFIADLLNQTAEIKKQNPTLFRRALSKIKREFPSFYNFCYSVYRSFK